LWQRAHFCWNTAAPRLSCAVQSVAGFEGGSDRQPEKLIALIKSAP
jgi:hypothetical protein